MGVSQRWQMWCTYDITDATDGTAIQMLRHATVDVGRAVAVGVVPGAAAPSSPDQDVQQLRVLSKSLRQRLVVNFSTA